MSEPIRPVVLLVLDGWGIAPPSRGNAITLARIPVFNRLITTYPTFVLQAGGEAVGLPWGEMGNSEVGHLSLGSGKILYQDLPRINRSIADKSFFNNSMLVSACSWVKDKNTKLHLVGLVSPGGVHSYSEHLYALIELAKEQGVKEVYVHCILDGRDTPFNSGLGFVEDLQKFIDKIGLGKIASVAGRFYAMDRDNHWERIQAYYQALTKGEGNKFNSATEAINDSYQKKVYDEEMPPSVIVNNGEPLATIKQGDSVVFFNFRSDRARQLTQSFVLPKFQRFEREYLIDVFFVTMTEYEKGLTTNIAFPPQTVDHPLARVISEANLKQFHIAETEKYAHVTYFFNGGREKAFPGEDHVLIPSPVVPSYDQKPAMSAREITKRLSQEIREQNYNFYVVNYANADMVGHTGNLPATVKAVEFLDEMLGEVVAAVLEVNGILLITADHGNAEGLINLQTGTIDKEHSASPVPLIIVANDLEHKAAASSPITEDLSQIKSSGLLTDVAPTVLHLLGLNKPSDMTGISLL